MDYNKISLTKSSKWNRKILNSYWHICLIYLVGELLFLLLRLCYYPAYSTRAYVFKYILIPDILLAIVMLFSELHFKYVKKYKEELIILSAVLLANIILVTINPVITGSQIVLILPILISVFYYRKKTMLYSLIANLSIFSLIYMLSKTQREYISIFSFALINLIIIGVAITCIGILERGTELLKSVEELVKSEEKLIIEKTMMDKLSKTDALTGLYNHITFHEYLDTVIAQCDANNLTLQLALIDIDNFKVVNDSFGHRVGDIIIKEVALSISNNVTPDDFVARYGGDEFSIIFTNKSINEAYDIIEKIRIAVENINYAKLKDKTITISAGLHNYKNQEGKDALFNNSDASLYDAKNFGKNKTYCS